MNVYIEYTLVGELPSSQSVLVMDRPGFEMGSRGERGAGSHRCTHVECVDAGDLHLRLVRSLSLDRFSERVKDSRPFAAQVVVVRNFFFDIFS